MEIGEFREAFCPYGYLDIKMAVEAALASGHDGIWVFELIEAFSEECCIKIADIDPCYVVLDAIMQDARHEIDRLIGFDITNDASFEVYGNYMCSGYDWKNGDIDALKEALKEYDVYSGDLSDATVYWLGMVEVDLGEL